MPRALTARDRPIDAPRLPAAVRPATGIAAFVAAYLLLDWLSFIHPVVAFGVTPWNPQPALAIALLLLAGQRMIPVVLAAVVLSEILVRGAPATPAATLLASTALTLGYATTAQWLAGSAGPRIPLVSRGDLVRLLGAVGGGTLLTGAFFIGTLIASGYAPPGSAPRALLQFWIGDCVGIVVTLPVILAFVDRGRLERLGKSLSHPETLAQLAAAVLALWFVLRGPPADQVKYFYLLFLPVVWVATRHGLGGAALAIGFIQAGIAIEVHGSAYESHTVFELQAEVIALAVTGLFLGVTVDEREHMGEELRQSLHLAAAGRMAAALAHELNQPLTALTSYAASARRLAAAPAESREPLSGALDRVVGEARRAAQVVRRMRDFFRTGSVDLQPTRCDEVARAVVEAMRADALARGAEIRVDAAAMPVVLADALQLEIVLRNLVANALDALAPAPAPRTVVIGLRHDGGRFVEVTVRDNGPGLSPEARSRLFEPFATTRAAGMGMGLAICRAIVEAHGGTLRAGDGPGGVFVFTVPVGEAADE
jgi:signal transduction histidine kinase